MKKILLIEDEPALQNALKEILQKEKFEVASALDGEEGIAMAKNEKPDLVLLDLILPKKDGFEVLQELKKEKATQEIPIIVLTNLESVADVGKALELGATTYLVKANYELEDIIRKVKGIVGES